MSDNLDIPSLQEEIATLEQKINSASAANDFDLVAELNQPYKKKSEILAALIEQKSLLSEIEEAKELLADPDFEEIATNEISRLDSTLEKVEKRIEILTAKELENDNAKAMMEFRAGTGGVEAALFTEDIYRMYIRYLQSQKIQYEDISTHYNDEGGIKEAIIAVNTPGSFGQLRYESGVHRVQRVPTTESSGRIHTSAMSVTVLPQSKVKKVEIPENDLKVDVFRSSGPGGQSVNTTDSAVRITHLPSGIVVSCQDGKSQHKNREKALRVLATRLEEIERQKHAKETGDLRSQSIGTGDRSAKIRTYNFPQSRITDHRVKITWNNLTEALNGDIDEIISTVNSLLRKEE